MKYVVLIIIFILLFSEVEYLFKINFHRILNQEYYKGKTFSIKNKSLANINRIEVGKEKAKKKSIIICSLARNVENLIKNTMKKLIFIGKKFQNYKIIIFENGSSDNTRNIFKDYENENIILLDCCNLNSCDCKLKKKPGYDIGTFSKQRINNMALYREQYLNYIKKKYNNYDYTLVIDFDLNGNFNIDGLYHSISYENWDGIFINGRIPIMSLFGTCTTVYDGMAYTDINDQYTNKRNLLSFIYNVFIMNYLCLKNKKLIPVKSAFNGVGVYKTKKIINCSYLGDFDCEHINLSKCMTDKGYKLFINPLWIGYFDIQGPGGYLTLIYDGLKN